jgi:hypothetical protein
MGMSQDPNSENGLVLVFYLPFEQNEHHCRKGWLSRAGKCINLSRVSKTKYLVVSPFTDNFEQLDLEVLEISLIPIS